ncbi:MAG: hypothetical protein ACOC3E_02135 [Cyanobacteriota bacterium]
MGIASLTESSLAQSSLPNCQPPKAEEYLLLVPTQTQQSQEQMRLAIPEGTNAVRCQYLGNTVLRIGEFQTVNDAENWAQYVDSVVGLSPVIIRPSATPATTIASPASAPQFNPQPLGTGYAVLVDYLNQPQIASQLRQLLGKDVGLVSYLARPYLLVIHTNNEGEANRTLRQLSDRGYWPLVVDSRQVTVLTPVVNY